MLVRDYSREQRRALNTIWNAAGDYSFEPGFMAFSRDGTPDFYMNTVVGLTFKLYDREKISSFFDRVSLFLRRDEFDDLLWLGLEEAVFQHEEADRLSLSDLRREHGELFFKELGTVSRQQMMLQSMLTLNQQEARWAYVTGRRAPVLTPREQRIRERLLFPNTDDTDEIIEVMEGLLNDFFKADIRNVRPVGKKPLFRRSALQRDRLVVRTGAEGDPAGRFRRNEHGAGAFKSQSERNDDLKYIREHFGDSVIPEPEMRTIREQLLTGGDSGADIYVAGNKTVADRRELKDAAVQGERNRAYIKANARFLAASGRRLAARIEAAVADYSSSLPEEGMAGVLDPQQGWRLPVLHDTHVFLRNGDEKERDFSVMLLLDASTSRTNTQELIAAQSVLISKALEKCNIPAAVLSFRSIRGVTVLQVLKDYDSRDEKGILGYFAAGWNRDSLALKASDLLMKRYDGKRGSPGRKQIVLVLTDASPNDSVGLPNLSGRGRLMSYEGEPAVKETEDAAASLRSRGTIVNALYYGSTANMENLHRIYGTHYVRVRSLSQIGLGVAELLESSLRELESLGGRGHV